MTELKHWVVWRPPSGGRTGRWVLKFEVAPQDRRELTVPRAVAPGPRERRAAERWAEEQLPRLRSQDAKGTPDNSPPAEQTLEELAPRFLELAAKDPNVSPATRAEYESHLRLSILPHLGRQRPSELTLARLRSFVRDDLAGLARQTRSNRLSTLSTVLTVARAEEWTTAPNLTADEAVRAALPPQERQRVDILRPEAFATLVGCDRIPPVRRLRYLMAALAGLCDGEIAGLRVRHVNLRPGEESITVDRAVAVRGPQGYATEQDPKNQYRKRVIPLPPALAEALRWWIAEGLELWTCRVPDADSLLFPSARGCASRPKSAGLVRRDLGRAGVAVPPKFNFHKLRACFATWLRRAGVKDETRTALMGHRGASTAERHYTGDIDPELRDAVGRLPPARLPEASRVHRRVHGAHEIEPPSRLELETYGLRKPSDGGRKSLRNGAFSQVLRVVAGGQERTRKDGVGHQIWQRFGTGSPRSLCRNRHSLGHRIRPQAVHATRPCAFGVHTSQSRCRRSSHATGRPVEARHPSQASLSALCAPAGIRSVSSRDALRLRRRTLTVAAGTSTQATAASDARTRAAKRSPRSRSFLSRSATR